MLEGEPKFKSLFEELASNRGYTPRKRNSSDKNCKNVSHILTGKGKEGKPIKIKVDVKKSKIKSKTKTGFGLNLKTPVVEMGGFTEMHTLLFLSAKKTLSL